MRRAIVLIGLLLAVLFVGYRVWPIVSAARLGAAVERGDRQAALERIDLRALQRTLARDVGRAYLEESGRGNELAGGDRSGAIASAAALALPLIEKVLTADNLIAFLKEGRIADTSGMEKPLSLDNRLPPFSKLIGSDIVRVVLISYFDGSTRFVVIADDPAAAGTRYGLVFALRGFAYRLVELDLPRPLRVELARALMARERKGT